MTEAVLFDFDGTVINTNELIIESYKYAFHKVLKREVSMEEILSLFGRPLILSFKEKYGEAGEALGAAFREYNESRHDEVVKAFPNALSGIDMIKKAGFKTGIVTSKRRKMLLRGLEVIGLSGVFDVLIANEDTAEHKPSPEPILAACQRLGVIPQNAIYVGDSVFDMLCGKNAGCLTCGVSYTLTEQKKLYDAGMDYFTDDILSLAKEVLKI